jgi:hypothetical protein
MQFVSNEYLHEVGNSIDLHGKTHTRYAMTQFGRIYGVSLTIYVRGQPSCQMTEGGPVRGLLFTTSERGLAAPIEGSFNSELGEFYMKWDKYPGHNMLVVSYRSNETLKESDPVRVAWKVEGF